MKGFIIAGIGYWGHFIIFWVLFNKYMPRDLPLIHYFLLAIAFNCLYTFSEGAIAFLKGLIENITK